MHVDDILVTGDSPLAIQEVIQQLDSQFALKTLGEVHYFLGIEGTKTDGHYYLFQSQFIYLIS